MMKKSAIFTPLRLAYFGVAAALFGIGAAAAALPTPVVNAVLVDIGLVDIHVGSDVALQAFKPGLLQSMASFVTPTTVTRDAFYQGGTRGRARYTYSSASCPALDHGLQESAAAGGCWIAASDTNREPGLWGAYGDGAHDDSAAMVAWAASVTDSTKMIVPSGVYDFATPFAFPVVSHVDIDAYGARLRYTGANLGANLVTAGRASTSGPGASTTVPESAYCSAYDWHFRGLNIDSATPMTGGWALQLNDLCSSEVIAPTAGALLNPTGGLYNGVHVNGGNSVHIDGGSISASNDLVTLNGDYDQQLTDPKVMGNTRLIGGKIGIHVAGNVGGLVADATEMIFNQTEIKVDQSLTALPNLQIFLGPTLIMDQSATAQLWVTDPGGPYSSIFATGSWMSGGGTACIIMDTGTNWTLNWTGGTIQNCDGGSAYTGGGAGIVNRGSSRLFFRDAFVDNMPVAFDNSAGLGTIASCSIAYGVNIGIAKAAGKISPCASQAASYFAPPSVGPTIDSTGAAQTLKNGGTIILPICGGSLQLANPLTGEEALFLLGGGTVSLLGSTASGFIAAGPSGSQYGPASGKIAVNYRTDLNTYEISSAYGQDIILTAHEVCTRTGG